MHTGYFAATRSARASTRSIRRSMVSTIVLDWIVVPMVAVAIVYGAWLAVVATGVEWDAGESAVTKS